jgi:hypothetical protein
MTKTVLAPFIVSIVGFGFFMNHFWLTGISASVLWSLAGASAIYCLYSGIIHRSMVEMPHQRGMLMAATVVGGIILLGITLSAIFVFVPTIR